MAITTNDPSIALSHHVTAVEALATEGGTVPNEWKAIKANYDTFAAHRQPAFAPLAAAVASDKPLTQDELYRLNIEAHLGALLQTDSTASARVAAAIDAETLVALRNAYATAAPDNYRKLAARFDKGWQTFAKAYETTRELGNDPHAIARAEKSAQQAWLELPTKASAVEGALGALRTAAILLGLEVDGMDGVMGLVIDGRGKSSHLIEQAWTTSDERIGRWGAVHERGVPVRAVKIEDFQPLSEQRSKPVEFSLASQ